MRGRSSGLGNALRLFLRVQWRSRFPHVYAALALLTVAAFRTAIPEDLVTLLLPAFVFGEPGTLALFLVAAQRYYERNERSTTALVVTPLSSGAHVAALVASSALVGTAAGVFIQAGVLGLDARIAMLVPTLFLTTALGGLLGLGISALTPEFTRFLMASVPANLFFSLPFAAYFGLTPRIATAWVPTDPALFSLATLVTPEPDLAAWAGYTALLVLYNAIAFVAVHRLFRVRVRERLEMA